MKIGILGGTFDPIHNAHLYIGYEAKKQLGLDKVIFMPAGIQPLKVNEKVTSSELRLKMVNLAIKSYEFFESSTYEIEKEGLSFTYETLQYLRELYKDDENLELYFISGADCLINIEKWKAVDKILSLSKLVVFMRGGSQKDALKKQKRYIENKFNANITFLDLKELEISSTDIRKRIKENKRIDFFVPQDVAHFIYRNKLYS